MPKRVSLRDKNGRVKQRASTIITDVLKENAEAFDINIKALVRNELEKKYKENVLASYTPRTLRGQGIKERNKSLSKYRTESGKNYHREKVTYRHTGIFINSIYSEVDGDKIKIKIRNEKYPDGASTSDVYKWLTRGTKGGGDAYPYIKMQGANTGNPDNYSTGWSRNFATPAHLFEEHTKLQMEGFLESLKNDLEQGNIKSNYQKYIRKRK